MSKKPKRGAKKATAVNKGTATDRAGVTPGKVLVDLLRLEGRTKEEVSGLNGAYGQAIKTAVEEKHLNRKAYNMLKGVWRMTPEKALEVMTMFELYCDSSGFTAKMSKVQRLDLGDNPPGEAEQEQEQEQEQETERVSGEPVSSLAH